MRVMIKFAFPTESGNEIAASGKIDKIFQSLTEDLKPEAAYFYPENGKRGGIFVVNVEDSSQVAQIAEPFWLALKAEVQLTPVMSPEDLQKGLSGMEGLAKRYS